MSASRETREDDVRDAPPSGQMPRFPRPTRSRLQFLLELLTELVSRDVKLRYKRTVLGVAWSLVNPIAQLVVLFFVFGFVLPLQIEHYLSFLFTGLLVWSWLQGSLMAAATAIVDNASLMRRPGFPGPILPLAVVTTQLVHFVLAFPILFLALVWDGKPISVALFALPVVLLIQIALTVGLGYVVSTLHVTFRDTQHLLGVFLMLAFYLSPVFYDQRAIPAQYGKWFLLNPMTHLLNAYRAILIEGRWPDPIGLAVVSAMAAAALVYGYRRFRRVSQVLVEEL